MDLIKVMLAERPTFHCGETEINRNFDPGESLLPRKKAEKLALQQLGCYGISADVAHFIRDTVNHSSRTLETGAGISTLIFAIKNATHVAITPNGSEIESIRHYAKTKQINLNRVRFIIEASDQYLPNSDIKNLDMVFLDGKHAFPWPIIDWFYTADRLRRGGIMMVDDAQMQSIRILVDFMSVDPRWKLIRSFENKTFAFQKERDSVHDIAWHMQPYNMALTINRWSGKTILRSIIAKLKKIIVK